MPTRSRAPARSFGAAPSVPWPSWRSTLSPPRRVVITGMAINTPLGDTPQSVLDGLLAGRSALTRWQAVDTSKIYCKVGADLSSYDIAAKVASFEGRVSEEVAKRLRRLTAKAPWSTRLTLLMALDGAMDAGLLDGGLDLTDVAAIVAGHNINLNYQYENRLQFEQEPDFIDSMLSLHGLDTDHVGRVSELLGIKGPIYTVGAACASANTALRCGVDEIRHHGVDAVVVTGAVLEFSPIELHAMALMGAISYASFNDAPEKASRPYDVRREGVVPAPRGRGAGVRALEGARRGGADRRDRGGGAADERVDAASLDQHRGPRSGGGSGRLPERPGGLRGPLHDEELLWLRRDQLCQRAEAIRGVTWSFSSPGVRGE